MPIDWSVLGIPKGTPRLIDKATKRKDEAKAERECRKLTRARDKGRCRIPNCRESAQHLHHILFRSKSRIGKWDTRRCCWLCVTHHQMAHAHLIDIAGDADGELVITGDIDCLKFRI